jgi:tol-pal system protein YbgF
MKGASRSSWWLVVVALAVGTTVPLSAANREHQQLMADIRMLQEQNAQLQQVLAAVTDSLRTVTAKLDEQSTVDRRTAADQKLQVDSVAGDVRVVRERLDDTNVRLSSLAQEIDALRQSIPKYPPPGWVDPTAAGVPPVAGPPGTPTDPGVPGDPAAAPPPVVPSTAGLSPQRMFDEAKGDYAVGHWALALAGFDTLIKTFPRSDLAPEAQYYIGETHMLEGKNDRAAAAYAALIASYASSPLVPSAYYKQGIALYRLGQVERAIASWEHCVNTYPDSEASRLARQSLEGARRPRQ